MKNEQRWSEIVMIYDDLSSRKMIELDDLSDRKTIGYERVKRRAGNAVWTNQQTES